MSEQTITQAYPASWVKREPSIVTRGAKTLCTLAPSGLIAGGLFLLGFPLEFAAILPALTVVDGAVYSLEKQRPYSFARHFYQQFNPMRFSRHFVWDDIAGKYVTQSSYQHSQEKITIGKIQTRSVKEADQLQKMLGQDYASDQMLVPLLTSQSGYAFSARPIDLKQDRRSIFGMELPSLEEISRHFFSESKDQEIDWHDFTKSPIDLEDAPALAHALKSQAANEKAQQDALALYVTGLEKYEQQSESWSKFLSENIYTLSVECEAYRAVIEAHTSKRTDLLAQMTAHSQVRACGFVADALHVVLAPVHPKIANKLVGPYTLTYGDKLFVKGADGKQLSLGSVQSAMRRALAKGDVEGAINPLVGYLKHNANNLNLCDVDYDFTYDYDDAPNWAESKPMRAISKNITELNRKIQKMEMELHANEKALIYGRRKLADALRDLEAVDTDTVWLARAKDLMKQREQVLALRPVKFAKYATWKGLVYLHMDFHPYIYEGPAEDNYVARNLEVAVPVDHKITREFWIVCAKDPETWPHIHMNVYNATTCWGNIEHGADKALEEGDMVAFTLLLLTIIADKELDQEHRTQLWRFVPTPKRPGWYFKGAA